MLVAENKGLWGGGGEKAEVVRRMVEIRRYFIKLGGGIMGRVRGWGYNLTWKLLFYYKNFTKPSPSFLPLPSHYYCVKK